MGWNYDKKETDRMILGYVPARDGLQKIVCDAMADAVEAGGKRVRPILINECYRLFCGLKNRPYCEEEVAPFMSAMEMIHTSSLIHDDLPCMDGDVLRRGLPTTWVTYGEDMATLAGDGLLIEAFYVMSDAAARAAERCIGIQDGEELRIALDKAVRAAQVSRLISDKAGIRGMVGGQTVDVEKTGKPLKRNELDFIYALKTGALLEASMMAGAILGGADEEETELIRRIASDVGLAFQIQDDILDETADEAALGKPVHSDAGNEKTTYVTIYGIEEASRKVSEVSDEAIELLGTLKERGGDTDTLSALIDALTKRDR